jgi:hypothetical protein
VADAVVGHQDHECLVEEALGLEAGQHAADVGVGEPDGVEVGRPVGEQDRVGWQVGGQRDRRPIGRRAERGRRLLPHPLAAGLSVAELAAGKLHLHEERLAGPAAGPVLAVVDRGVPLEVEVGLAEALRPAARLAGGLGQPVADAGVPAGLLEDRRHRPHAGGQADLLHAAAAAVVMGPDRGLVHPRDHGRAARGADGRRHEGVGEPRPLGGQAINVRGGHGPGAVAAEVGRHVVDDDPDDVRPVGYRRRRHSGHQHRRDECRPRGHARISLTTWPCTSVSRKSRPWNRQVSFVWSKPSR